MDLSKSREFFDPSKVEGKLHIIGCGSVGSTLAENLARCGCDNFVLYDFDVVEQHNLVNQMFRVQDIGKNKAECLTEILKEINPEVKVKVVTEGWNGKLLSGYIFLAVDNIELRRQFVEQHLQSPVVKAVFDFRTTLTLAQHYAADWHNDAQRKNLLDSMQFSHEEAAEESPVSACGITLGVAPTVRTICAAGVCNFINFCNKKTLKKFIQIETFAFFMDAFD